MTINIATGASPMKRLPLAAAAAACLVASPAPAQTRVDQKYPTPAAFYAHVLHDCRTNPYTSYWCSNEALREDCGCDTPHCDGNPATRLVPIRPRTRKQMRQARYGEDAHNGPYHGAVEY
jgi:hypothetical protein